MLEQDRHPAAVILVDDSSPLPVSTLLPAACRELSGAGGWHRRSFAAVLPSIASCYLWSLFCQCPAESHPSLVVERLPAARGPAAARNAGLLLASSMGAQASGAAAWQQRAPCYSAAGFLVPLGLSCAPQALLLTEADCLPGRDWVAAMLVSWLLAGSLRSSY